MGSDVRAWGLLMRCVGKRMVAVESKSGWQMEANESRWNIKMLVAGITLLGEKNGGQMKK